MEWHSNLIRPSFIPPASADQTSFNLLFNSNLQPYPPGMEVKQAEMMIGSYGDVDCLSGQLLMADKKKRLTSEQLESLESSFQEEIKLDPERKMKLARELALQPRQVAVWFQNRRARWKAKQLERLYDSLKLEFDNVSREKHKLQDEVMKLRAMLIEQATRNNHINMKQVSMGCNEVSGGDETVESTSEAVMLSGGRGGAAVVQQQQPPQQSGISECQNYMFDEYNNVVSPPLPPYWAVLPAYPC